MSLCLGLELEYADMELTKSYYQGMKDVGNTRDELDGYGTSYI